jgi:hypothetical protein
MEQLSMLRGGIMLRKSLAVVGLVSAMVLASPAAGALPDFGTFLGADGASSWTDLRLERDGLQIYWGVAISDRSLGSWEVPSAPPRHFTPESGRRHWGTAFPARRNGSAIDGRRCRPRPGSAVPEPGAALLFGVGALLVGRRLHPR